MMAERLAPPTPTAGSSSTASRGPIAQAEALARLLKDLGQTLDTVVYFDVSEPELLRRLTGRRRVPRVRPLVSRDVEPAEARRASATVRRGALSARGRRRGHGAQPSGSVPAADGAAPRLLPPAGTARDGVRRGAARRRFATRSGVACGSRRGDRAEVGARDRAHAAGGAHPGRRHGSPARLRSPGHVDARDRRGRRGVHPSRGRAPAFKGYRGFPATVCISINEEVVHGIPSARRRSARATSSALTSGAS